MMIYWPINYLGPNDRRYRRRTLWLNTASLDPATRAAVEFTIETGGQNNWQMLKYRSLFVEDNSDHHQTTWQDVADRLMPVMLMNYVEDEHGNRLSEDEHCLRVTGLPGRLIHAGTKQHHIDLMLANAESPPLDNITLTPEQIRLFGYFARDVEELLATAFMTEKPVSLSDLQSENPVVKTSVSDEEIRSFVTIFRRLYMEKEPANFAKTAELFAAIIDPHAYGKWVTGVKGEYDDALQNPSQFPMLQVAGSAPTFTVKRVIDVFLYTRYAHQPSPDRERQFAECLAQVSGKDAILYFYFLSEVWGVAHFFRSGASAIVPWFRRWCEHHQITPAVLESLMNQHPGVGSVEKEGAKKERIFNEKAEELARALWLAASVVSQAVG
jgi:hypothetical protein